MTDPARKRRVKDSNPKIRSLGWEDLEPTQLIDKATERLREAASSAKRLTEPSPPLPTPKGV